MFRNRNFPVFGRKDGGPDYRLKDRASHGILEVKAAAEGRIGGYASKWDLEDSYGEAVVKGAFAESLIEWGGRPIPMLWQHQSGQPIGVWDEYREDGVGLYVEGPVNLETQRGREAMSDIKMGSVSGLSIGYYELVVDSWEEARKNGVRKLHKLDLRETSPVTFPALREAQIDAIKARKAHGQIPTLREFEEGLRERLLLTRSQAAIVASRGYVALLRDSEGQDDDAELKAALAGLTLSPLNLPKFGV